MKIIKKLQELYPDLEIEESFGKVAGGYLSDNFSIGNNEKKYFLRQYRSQYDRERIESMHRIKKFFLENGIPIIPPIETSEGKTFFELKGRFYALFPFIEEETIEASNLSFGSIRSIGKMLAKIHVLSKDGFPNITEVKTEIFNKEKAIEQGEEFLKIIKEKEKLDDFDRMALRQITYKLEKIRENDTTVEDLSLKSDHLIHGDFHELNLFFANNGEVKFVYDLEKAVIAPRAYEIARSLDYICLTKFDEDHYIKAKEFIKAYRSIYELSDQELRKGWIFWCLKNVHSFWIEKAHYLENNTRTDVFYPMQDKKLLFYAEKRDEVVSNILGEL